MGKLSMFSFFTGKSVGRESRNRSAPSLGEAQSNMSPAKSGHVTPRAASDSATAAHHSPDSTPAAAGLLAAESVPSAESMPLHASAASIDAADAAITGLSAGPVFPELTQSSESPGEEGPGSVGRYVADEDEDREYDEEAEEDEDLGAGRGVEDIRVEHGHGHDIGLEHTLSEYEQSFDSSPGHGAKGRGLLDEDSARYYGSPRRSVASPSPSERASRSRFEGNQATPSVGAGMAVEELELPGHVSDPGVYYQQSPRDSENTAQSVGGKDIYDDIQSSGPESAAKRADAEQEGGQALESPGSGGPESAFNEKADGRMASASLQGDASTWGRVSNSQYDEDASRSRSAPRSPSRSEMVERYDSRDEGREDRTGDGHVSDPGVTFRDPCGSYSRSDSGNSNSYPGGRRFREERAERVEDLGGVRRSLQSAGDDTPSDLAVQGSLSLSARPSSGDGTAGALLASDSRTAGPGPDADGRELMLISSMPSGPSPTSVHPINGLSAAAATLSLSSHAAGAPGAFSLGNLNLSLSDSMYDAADKKRKPWWKAFLVRNGSSTGQLDALALQGTPLEEGSFENRKLAALEGKALGSQSDDNQSAGERSAASDTALLPGGRASAGGGGGGKKSRVLVFRRAASTGSKLNVSENQAGAVAEIEQGGEKGTSGVEAQKAPAPAPVPAPAPAPAPAPGAGAMTTTKTGYSVPGALSGSGIMGASKKPVRLTVHLDRPSMARVEEWVSSIGLEGPEGPQAWSEEGVVDDFNPVEFSFEVGGGRGPGREGGSFSPATPGMGLAKAAAAARGGSLLAARSAAPGTPGSTSGVPAGRLQRSLSAGEELAEAAVEEEEEDDQLAGLSTANALTAASRVRSTGQLAGYGSGNGGMESDHARGLVDLDTAHANSVLRTLDRGVTSVYLCARNLHVVPVMAGFHSLKKLDLSRNSITRIPAGCLPRGLHWLDLSSNQIAAIEGLRDLSRLRVLNLSNNRIRSIGSGKSAGLAGCSALQELYLAGNKISDVDGLHRLLKLSVLDVSRNKITSTKGLGQLAANYASMQALDLTGNPVHTNLGADAFRRYISGLLPHLVYLNKQPLKPVSLHEAANDNIARAALGPSNHHSSRSLRPASSSRHTHRSTAPPASSSAATRRSSHHRSERDRAEPGGGGGGAATASRHRGEGDRSSSRHASKTAATATGLVLQSAAHTHAHVHAHAHAPSPSVASANLVHGSSSSRGEPSKRHHHGHRRSASQGGPAAVAPTAQGNNMSSSTNDIASLGGDMSRFDAPAAREISVP